MVVSVLIFLENISFFSNFYYFPFICLVAYHPVNYHVTNCQIILFVNHLQEITNACVLILVCIFETNFVFNFH